MSYWCCGGILASYTRDGWVAGWSPFYCNDKYFCHWIQRIHWKHVRKTQLCLCVCVCVCVRVIGSLKCGSLLVRPNSKAYKIIMGLRWRGARSLFHQQNMLFLPSSCQVLPEWCGIWFLGGALIFDDTDLHLQAENILITDGGLLQVKSFPSMKFRLRSRKCKGECQILFLVFFFNNWPYLWPTSIKFWGPWVHIVSSNYIGANVGTCQCKLPLG